MINAQLRESSPQNPQTSDCDDLIKEPENEASETRGKKNEKNKLVFISKLIYELIFFK
jgi:hypothetical protein